MRTRSPSMILRFAMLLLPALSILGAEPLPRFLPVDLGAQPNIPHAEAFGQAKDLGFQEWFPKREVLIHGVPFVLAQGPKDLVRLAPGQSIELPLPARPTFAVHLLASGGYLPADGEWTVEMTIDNQPKETRVLAQSDWNYGARHPEILAATLDAGAFGGAGKSLYHHTVRLQGWRSVAKSLRLTAGDQGVYLLAAITTEGVVSQSERLSGLPASSWEIWVAQGADPIMEFAAEEMQLYASDMTGKRPEIRHVDENALSESSSPRLILGFVPKTVPVEQGKQAIAERDRLSKDGFVVRTMGQDTVILGQGSNGILYGVYALLERQGCRFFFPGPAGEVVPKGELDLSGLNLVEDPSWARRGLTYYPYAFDSPADWVDFVGKLRMNTILFHAGDPQWWEKEKKVLWPECQKRGIHVEFGGHLLPGMLPRELFDTHPDWFRSDGEKRVKDWNFCPSNRDALKVVWENVQAFVSRNPEPEVFSIWPDDLAGGGWCHCDKCQNLSPTDQSLMAMNEVARALRSVRDDARVVFLAYQDTLDLGAKIRPEPNVTLLWAPRERCYVHGLDDPACPRNQAHKAALERLLKVFDPGQAEAFEYYLDQILYQDLVPTLPDTLAQDLRYYRSLNMKCIEPLMVSLIPFHTLPVNALLTARLEWEKDADPRSIVSDFCERWFGDASLTEYYDRRAAALRPILDRSLEGQTITEAQKIQRRQEIETSLTVEFPQALGLLMKAQFQVKDPICQSHLQEEKRGLIQVMDRAQSLARTRFQPEPG